MRIKWFVVLMVVVVSSLSATVATKDNVAKLYVATFDRAADGAGLDYWVGSGWELESIAMSFFDQKETVEKYPAGSSVYDFVSAVYLNLFDRYPDQEGGDYWVEALLDGNTSPSLFILAVINGAVGDDSKVLDNKTEVGLAFAKIGSKDIQASKDVIANVTYDHSTVTDALAEVDKLDGGSSTPTDLPENVKAVVNKHNAIRAELYAGSEMKWSETLANLSQAYANQLAQRGVMEHEPNSPYGENLAISTAEISYEYSTELWYSEKPDYDYSTNSCIGGAMCGHYTQIIWKNSTEIGCGSAINQTGTYQGGNVVVCKYNPAGNYIGQRPY